VGISVKEPKGSTGGKKQHSQKMAVVKKGYLFHPRLGAGKSRGKFRQKGAHKIGVRGLEGFVTNREKKICQKKAKSLMKIGNKKKDKGVGSRMFWVRILRLWRKEVPKRCQGVG